MGEHVLHRAEMGDAYRCVVEELEGMKPPGTPRLRCQDVIKTGLVRTVVVVAVVVVVVVPELTWLKIFSVKGEKYAEQVCDCQLLRDL